MLSVIAVGIELADITPYTDIAWAHHDPSMFLELSKREYMLICERVAKQADILLVNLDAASLTPDQIVILYTAYSNSTPVLAIGLKTWSPLIEEMVAQKFADLDMAVQHIEENYKLKK